MKTCLKYVNRMAAMACLLINVLAARPAAAQWTLVWSDEFTESTINTAYWTFDTGNGSGGWGNNELEYYTSRPQNVYLSNGNLVIQAQKESYGGMSYTSARLKTDGLQTWTYGKIEARIKIPTGQGLWPAFWMLGSNIGSVGWPQCGEIDIMEHVNNASTIQGTMHWYVNGHAYYGAASPALDFTQYHIYSIEWDANAIKWFVDGTQYLEGNIANNINSTDAFHRPFFLLLNLAVGGNWPGNPDSSTVFPAAMYVDYVRVYKASGTAQVATPTFSPAPGTYSSAQNVTLSCATSGATIRYTTDGSQPTSSSTAYSSPINISATTSLNAKAFLSGMTDSATATGTYTISAPSIGKTWYLFNTPVSVSPAGQDLQTATSGVTGWQPIKSITATSSYWYSPAVTGSVSAGTWNFYLWSNSPGSASNVRVEVYRVATDGSGATLLGSQTKDVNASGTGNHQTVYSFNTATMPFSNQRLLVKLTLASGASATIAYNSNDFPTRLVTP